MLAAAGILLITTGTRQTLGLFVMPLNQDTGMSIVSISFALAVGQFVWGAVQPLFGAVADQYGSRRCGHWARCWPACARCCRCS